MAHLFFTKKNRQEKILRPAKNGGHFESQESREHKSGEISLMSAWMLFDTPSSLPSSSSFLLDIRLLLTDNILIVHQADACCCQVWSGCSSDRYSLMSDLAVISLMSGQFWSDISLFQLDPSAEINQDYSFKFQLMNHPGSAWYQLGTRLRETRSVDSPQTSAGREEQSSSL